MICCVNMLCVHNDMFCKYAMCPLNILEIPSPSDVKSGPDMHGISSSINNPKLLYLTSVKSDICINDLSHSSIITNPTVDNSHSLS